MSASVPCRCSERREPLVQTATSSRPARLWRVSQRNGHRSAFAGYRWTPSAFSTVTCLRCGGIWRTKATYVQSLLDRRADEVAISAGYPGHAEAMHRFARDPLP